MSGGSFDYAFSRVEMFADSLTNKLDAHDELPKQAQYKPEVIAKMREVAADARRLALFMKEVEWLDSDDIGEDTFIRRVAEIERKLT